MEENWIKSLDALFEIKPHKNPAEAMYTECPGLWLFEERSGFKKAQESGQWLRLFH